MALTEAAHMERAQARRLKVLEQLPTRYQEPAQDTLPTLSHWLLVIDRLPTNQARLYFLTQLGYQPEELARLYDMNTSAVARDVRSATKSLKEVRKHQEEGLSDSQLKELKTYAVDLKSSHGQPKTLDRRKRSQLRAHIRLCDVCSDHLQITPTGPDGVHATPPPVQADTPTSKVT